MIIINSSSLSSSSTSIKTSTNSYYNMSLDHYGHLHQENMGSRDDQEDAAIYAELTRQILMLIDDDDETRVGSEFKRRSMVSRGGLVASGGYFSWSESGRRVEVPSWMERLWAGNGGGTGVFIPRVVAAAGKSRRRRRNKQRKNTVNYGGIGIHG